jgi:alpha-amylase
MPSVCFYFQVHQPFRLKEYSFFEIGKNHFYESDKLNREVLNKVADKSYLPANEMMLNLIKKHNERFKIAFSISGCAIEQFELYRPDVLQSFVELANTGCVEFLSETYYHSLSFLYSKEEFLRQVEKHREKIKQYFNQEPKVFRNTELIYSNDLAHFLEELGYEAVLCEGVERILNKRTPNHLYSANECEKIKALLRNYKLSDDIAFRFSDRNWKEWPLTAKTFAKWLHKLSGDDEIINLFMDYETFGEHQWENSGIFDFMNELPTEVLKNKSFNFLTPSEIVKKYKAKEIIDSPEFISWADTERDLSAWLGNPMQNETGPKIYSMEKKVKATNDKDLINGWSKLTTSDHLYYMSTKYWNDGDVHKYFSPYQSPYDAYIYYMNAVSDFIITLDELKKTKTEDID